jgi:hypothetical protein
MKILLACHKSRRLHECLTANGHDVTSCDLSPAPPDLKHIQGDVRKLLPGSWDLMIAFPPCTYLAKAQEWQCQWSNGRRLRQCQAYTFVRDLWDSGIPQIAIENPTGRLSHIWRYPSQIVHPFFFGDPYAKEINLWLRNLPPLLSTSFNPIRKSLKNHTNSRMNRLQVSEIMSSWQRFPGLCQAIADQWCPPIGLS